MINQKERQYQLKQSTTISALENMLKIDGMSKDFFIKKD